MTASTRVRNSRTIIVLVLTALLSGLFALTAQPADAGVEGGCTGSADFTADNVGAYTPDNDTVDNAIIVPKADGNVAQWAGSVPGTNTNFSGKVEIQLGPVWVTVGDWGFPNFNGENDLDGRSDSGDYNMDEFWSAIEDNSPFTRDWIQGVYNARGEHTADGVDCTGQFMVKFEGSATESPLFIISIIILAIAVILLIIAGRRKKSGGRIFKGRPILVIIAMLLLAITIAILLQQFCKVPLNTMTTVILPIILILVGLVIAKIAPFGGPQPINGGTVPNGGPSGEDIVGELQTNAEEGDIFTDGFESGDTSAWTDQDPS